MARLVWAFEALDETNGETGYVELADDALAEKLIKAGKVQDGLEYHDHKHIDGNSITAYATRQLKAGEAQPKPTPEKRPEREPKPEPEVEPDPDGGEPIEPGDPDNDNTTAKKRGRPPGSSAKGN